MTRFALYVLIANMAVPAERPAWADQTTWDVVADFSSLRNPNGPWTYSGNHNVLHHTIPRSQGVPGLQTYYGLQKSFAYPDGGPDGTSIARNTTNHAIATGTVVIPPDHLLMDPQDGITNIFWQAPRAGSYTLTGDFQALDQNEHRHYVHIDVLGRTERLFNASIASNNPRARFSYVLQLKWGDTLNFTVQAGSQPDAFGTGLAAHIVASP